MTSDAPTKAEFVALQEQVSKLEDQLAGRTPAQRRDLVETPVAAIVADAAAALGLSTRAITSEMREEWLQRARIAIAWTARTAHGFTYARIARGLGRTDHTTARHAIQRAEQLRRSDRPFLLLTDQLLAAAEQRKGAQ